MTQPVSNIDAAEFAEILQRLMTIRSHIQIVLPEEIARARARLDETHPGGKNGSAVDYALLNQIARILTAQDQPISMGELGRALDVPLSSATRIVDWLEQSGFAERLPDPTDRRVVRVTLTKEGKSVYRLTRETMIQRIEAWLERFTPDQRRSLIDLVGKLVNIIEETGAR